jgi:hypothetical protein
MASAPQKYSTLWLTLAATNQLLRASFRKLYWTSSLPVTPRRGEGHGIFQTRDRLEKVERTVGSLLDSGRAGLYPGAGAANYAAHLSYSSFTPASTLIQYLDHPRRSRHVFSRLVRRRRYRTDLFQQQRRVGTCIGCTQVHDTSSKSGAWTGYRKVTVRISLTSGRSHIIDSGAVLAVPLDRAILTRCVGRRA